MKLKTKDFRKNNYFVLYTSNYYCNLYGEDQIICYIDNWEELHNKYLKNYRLSDLVNKFNNVYKSNIIDIEINNRKYKLATFTDFDEEIE